MRKIIALLAAITFCAATLAAYADYAVYGKGAWPQSWPKELEALREKSSTIQGSRANLIIHNIPFTKREDFEAAWPHILKIKSNGAPIILVKSPLEHWHFGKLKAGMQVHCPPKEGEQNPPNLRSTNPRERWMWSTYIELVVDGEIVDLNRIALPPETPIVDERFLPEKKPAAK